MIDEQILDVLREIDDTLVKTNDFLEKSLEQQRMQTAILANLWIQQPGPPDTLDTAFLVARQNAERTYVV